MARYKTVDTSPRFLPVDLSRQLLTGTIEHALNHMLEDEIDLSGLDARFCNDGTGAPAYPPATLRKPILFAYSRGIFSSREIERACRDNTPPELLRRRLSERAEGLQPHYRCIAFSGDQAPHFTTVAGFIRESGDEIANLFTPVLFICDAQGLMGRAILSSKAGIARECAERQRRCGDPLPELRARTSLAFTARPFAAEVFANASAFTITTFPPEPPAAPSPDPGLLSSSGNSSRRRAIRSGR